jgi:hypothetical protein
MMNWYEVKRVISSVNVSISVTANNEGLICYSAASLLDWNRCSPHNGNKDVSI